MDIVAVLTKVVQEQQESLKEMKAKNERLEKRLLEPEGKRKAGKWQIIDNLFKIEAGAETAPPFHLFQLSVLSMPQSL